MIRAAGVGVYCAYLLRLALSTKPICRWRYQRPHWPDIGGAKQFHLELMVDDLDKAAAALRTVGAVEPEFQPGGGTVPRAHRSGRSPILHYRSRRGRRESIAATEHLAPPNASSRQKAGPLDDRQPELLGVVILTPLRPH